MNIQTNINPSSREQLIVAYDEIYCAVANIEKKYLLLDSAPWMRSLRQSLEERDYVQLVRGHEQLEMLASKPEAQVPLEVSEKPLVTLIKEIQSRIKYLLSKLHRDSRPLRMGNPQEIENRVIDAKIREKYLY